MKAVIITEFGGPEVLQVVERPIPIIREEEVLIKVSAAGVNRPDIFQRKGNYLAPVGVVQDIPGLEIAGEVVQTGAKVDTVKVGDEVCCLVAGGGYAEYASVHHRMCLPVPEGFTFVEAASLPETVFTVWDNVFRRGKLKRDERILIHGGSGGIGSAAIQLCKAMGAEVYVTAGSEEKAVYCEQLGADHVLNYRTQDFSEVWQSENMNVVLDSIGGDYFSKHIALLAEDGRLVHINAVNGGKVELNIFKVMQKRIVITGSTLRARSLDFKIELADDVLKHIWPLLGQQYRPQVYKSIPLVEAERAHRMMEMGDVFGKLILIP
ncbi:NAD(P)H-quinone oxidoreductase [Sphingobacterium wenxiniae]|uniref:Putative NAD(P)H quinone oxidoreductase, PIG3 family n=1 Tax=Sphingobacterium wenxiniae TaxID=683125 RepID=A0A1I6Q3Q1_9SPHI|nr:NAD(P)H-quinone oxidoreductase [Sphingobacterium wenxiniae]SFS46978.1 putative NAD(P)H quinone oxidoreductase, PIG3 family [Sphingobacterium wenxiniae]